MVVYNLKWKPCSRARPHSGFKWLKPAKKNLPTVMSRIFQIKFQQIHLSSVSGHFKCFSLKMCQTVAAIRITSQFHEFFNFIFGGFLSFETSVRRTKTVLNKHYTLGESSREKNKKKRKLWVALKVVLSTACKTTTKGQIHIDLALMFDDAMYVLMTVHNFHIL